MSRDQRIKIRVKEPKVRHVYCRPVVIQEEIERKSRTSKRKKEAERTEIEEGILEFYCWCRED